MWISLVHYFCQEPYTDTYSAWTIFRWHLAYLGWITNELGDRIVIQTDLYNLGSNKLKL